MTLSAFKPQFPAITMAPETIFESAMQTGSTFVFCVPLFIEAGHHPELNSISDVLLIRFGHVIPLKLLRWRRPKAS
jgi:hypothetical protein